jgi:hypothetical protein
LSWMGKWVLGRPRRRYGMSRSRSRSDGSIGFLWAARIADFVWRVEEGDDGRGSGGRSDWTSGGIEFRPMYENWLLRGVLVGSSETELVRAFRKVRMEDLLDKTGYCQSRHRTYLSLQPRIQI